MVATLHAPYEEAETEAGQPMGAMLGEKKVGRQQTSFVWSVPSLTQSVNFERGVWMLAGQGTDWVH